MTPEERFWRFVDKNGPVLLEQLGPCWVWCGSRNENGYGKFGVNWHRPSYAHRFSWQIATGSPPGDLCVCHHCDNPSCVNPAHLFLGTHLDNALDKIAKGRAVSWDMRGANNPRAKLSAEQVVAIRREHADGATQVALAGKYSVSRSAIAHVVRGSGWKTVTDGPLNTSRERGRRGSANQSAKLDEESVARIRAELASGATGRALATKYGVSPGLISQVRRGKIWSHVCNSES